ncbi:hypothetical protein [Anaerosinus massiliensis]|uniref:hypothetical protein n=1 Tax=Massilibacillus massiliensis TaxID=1806837 RepID=UPI0018FE3775|nr:hypothetical protein [Massilibacillus massiliensis]
MSKNQNNSKSKKPNETPATAMQSQKKLSDEQRRTLQQELKAAGAIDNEQMKYDQI